MGVFFLDINSCGYQNLQITLKLKMMMKRFLDYKFLYLGPFEMGSDDKSEGFNTLTFIFVGFSNIHCVDESGFENNLSLLYFIIRFIHRSSSEIQTFYSSYSNICRLIVYTL